MLVCSYLLEYFLFNFKRNNEDICKIIFRGNVGVCVLFFKNSSFFSSFLYDSFYFATMLKQSLPRVGRRVMSSGCKRYS